MTGHISTYFRNWATIVAETLPALPVWELRGRGIERRRSAESGYHQMGNTRRRNIHSTSAGAYRFRLVFADRTGWFS